MMRWHTLTPRFVQYLPDGLDHGVLYVSIEYATAAHRCCCGCGEEVVTPFSPTGWRMTFDGQSVSLWPSIGSWNLPCRSHYVIDRNRAREAEPWSDADVVAERRRDRVAKARYYEATQPSAPTPPEAKAVSQPAPSPATTPSAEDPRGWWTRLRDRLFGQS